MRPRKPGRKLTWGTNIQMFACIWIYPAFQAFAAGFIFYGVVLLGLAVVMGVVGRRLYREGMAEEPGAQIRTYDHREKRPTRPKSQDGTDTQTDGV